MTNTSNISQMADVVEHPSIGMKKLIQGFRMSLLTKNTMAQIPGSTDKDMPRVSIETKKEELNMCLL